MRGQQREELVIDGRECVLLDQQPVDCDLSDHLVLDLQRHRGQRPLQRRFCVLIIAMEVIRFPSARDLAEDPVAEVDGEGVDARHEVLAIAGDGRQLMGFFVEEENGVRLGADEIADDLLHHADDFAKIERGVELIAGHVEAGEVVVLLLDFGVARGVIPGLFLEGAELIAQPLVLAQQLLHELAAFVEQLEKLLSSRLVAHLFEGNTAVQSLRRFR